jgi:predicted GIY-YIG superfamily endonuclease
MLPTCRRIVYAIGAANGEGEVAISSVWVYILHCADGSYYTGHTTNLEKRLAEHQSGEGGEWTRRRLPVELVFAQEMPDKDSAFLLRVLSW